VYLCELPCHVLLMRLRAEAPDIYVYVYKCVREYINTYICIYVCYRVIYGFMCVTVSLDDTAGKGT